MRRFKFIDECGSNPALTRLYGRAPTGERVIEGVPRNYGRQTSIISAVSLMGPSATFTIEGAVDTAVFDAYLEQVLGPTIEKGDVLILDNLSADRAPAGSRRSLPSVVLVLSGCRRIHRIFRR